MLILGWLVWHTISAQDQSPKSTPLTQTGITLPQLITTDFNRSNLQFHVNLTDGFERPNFSVNYEKFISDHRKQLRIFGGADLDHTVSFQGNDGLSLYSVDNMSVTVGANLKLFNKNDYFVEFGTSNRISKPGDLTEFDHLPFSNTLDIAIGKGRINYANDGASAIMIIEKLTEFGILQRNLSNDEYILLLQKIAQLKDRRKYANRSYPLSESEEIQEVLKSFEVIDPKVDITAIIDDAYRYEPMTDRTTGSQFRIGVRASHFRSNLFEQINSQGIVGTLSYSIHSAINSNWQYNKRISGYLVVLETGADNPEFEDNKIRKVGIGMDNDIHYLLDNRIRISLLTSIGYDFINKVPTFNLFGNPYFDNDGFYLKTSSEAQFQITRTMSATFGIDLNFSPEDTFTGLRLGLNF